MTQVAPVPLEKVVHFPLVLVVRLRNEDIWGKHGNFGSFKIRNSWRDEGREEAANQTETECGESTSTAAEENSQWVNVPLVPEGVFSSVWLHLLETLSHVDHVFAWLVNPLLLLFLHFLNIICWRLCFPSTRLGRREVLMCPHLHIYKTLYFSFFCLFCFSFSSSSLLWFFFCCWLVGWGFFC